MTSSQNFPQPDGRGEPHPGYFTAPLADDLPVSKSGARVQERLALWDMPILFLLMITLIGFEWLYRRWRGLV